MRVRIIGSVQGADAHLLHGDIVDLDAHVAEAWLADGHAATVDQDTPTTAEWPSSVAIEKAQADAVAAAAKPAEDKPAEDKV